MRRRALGLEHLYDEPEREAAGGRPGVSVGNTLGGLRPERRHRATVGRGGVRRRPSRGRDRTLPPNRRGSELAKAMKSLREMQNEFSVLATGVPIG